MTGDPIDPRVTWILNYMQQHLAEPMSVGDLAARINLSPSRFRALFTTSTGLGPAQYLQWLRLRRARLLLERTFLTVKEVMALVGYNDPSHFTRDFRRLHGDPPSSFRGRGVDTTTAAAPDSSSDPPSLKRIRPSRSRDPGVRVA